MDIVKFKKESEKVCHYCGKKITLKEELTVDHVVPVSKGGVNSEDNFVISCKACNSEKADLNAERYAEFLNIIKTMDENAVIVESVEKAINSLKEVLINFNGELYAMKSKLAALEKKRSALLDSLMYKKFNVVQGYDYAKNLRDITEEIYNLKLSISQMNKIQGSLTQISPFINSASPKGIRNEAVSKMRGEILSDYRSFTDETATN
jgi:DNA-directed RNA polymerase subunit RPC12/RpoP